MKRFWIALSLLLVLLIVSLGSLWYFAEASDSLLQALSEAKEFADAGDFSGASSAFTRAENLWKQRERILRYFLDREEMAQVENAFALCKGYLAHKNLGDFSATCRQGLVLVENLFSEEFPAFENLL